MSILVGAHYVAENGASNIPDAQVVRHGLSLSAERYPWKLFTRLIEDTHLAFGVFFLTGAGARAFQ